ncbi:hypothetical protein A8B81_08185 [Sulfitobacter pontiacus]|uniref:hypothetical protein n=1 Tax=Sulfitobacter pontiacus TaxID=60137 RepID=UPI0007D91F34|nr:hypothetical protein [Sulfitobacter pontiacus]OAN82959.1 hypothetical protein A8B81_08185 [Sulfitobacter pontiacus]
MIDVIKQFESVPAAYPDAPDDLSTAAAALDAVAIWARIEAYTAYRFTVREMVWTLRGDGGDEFCPRLTPVVSCFAHVWVSGAWEAVTLQEGPFGLCLPTDGIYRITAQVGAGDVPAAVSEAFRRLAEYSAGIGSSADSFTAANDGESSFERSGTWAARAIHNSGAADLLRPYRRV